MAFPTLHSSGANRRRKTAAADYVTQVLKNPPVSFWGLQEASGTSAADLTGNGHGGTYHGSVTPTASGPGSYRGQILDGSTGYVENGTATDFDGTQAMSASAWIYLTAYAGGDSAIVGTLNPAAGYIGWEFNIEQSPSNPLQFFAINSFSGNCIQQQSTYTPPLNAWTYVVVTYDGSRAAAGVNFYANGSLLGKAAPLHDSLGATTASGMPIRIGMRQNGGSALGARVALVDVCNFVLTGPQIAARYAAMR